MKKATMHVENKRNGKWTKTEHVYNDTLFVYESLMNELIHKKLEKCTYITSIKRIQNYNGTLTIIVNFIDNMRKVYTIETH